MVRLKKRAACLVAILLATTVMLTGCKKEETVSTPSSEAEASIQVAELRYDGIYQMEVTNSVVGTYWNCVRFLENGTTASILTTDTTIAGALQYFEDDSDSLARGTYEVNGQEITFTVVFVGTGANGGDTTLTYTGVIGEDSLTVDSHSDFNDATETGLHFTLIVW
jgi:hypothetical protein